MVSGVWTGYILRWLCDRVDKATRCVLHWILVAAGGLNVSGFLCTGGWRWWSTIDNNVVPLLVALVVWELVFFMVPVKSYERIFSLCVVHTWCIKYSFLGCCACRHYRSFCCIYLQKHQREGARGDDNGWGQRVRALSANVVWFGVCRDFGFWKRVRDYSSLFL